MIEVAKTIKGPRVIVSRSHPDLVKRLFELEVPEVSNGTVEIKSIAREAGYRSKVAVAARQAGIDPVGCCVGLRGIRIQNIVTELSGEKIDVVQWNADPATFIAGALSPAQIIAVELKKTEGVATVIVPDRQLSLAIGKEGQNARLAAKLTGWKIDIKMASVWETERESAKPAIAEKIEAVEEEAELPAPMQPVGAAVEKAEAAVEEVTTEISEEEVVEEAEEEVTEAKPVIFEVPRPTRGELRFAEDIMGAPSRGEGKGKKKKKAAPSKEREGEAPPRPRKGGGRRQEIAIEDETDF